ncbi:MAG: ABC-F family ATP-binding cassette domain-containing protein [Candidatus Polarisedimenticolia bacterium]
MIRLEGVSRSYGSREVLRELSWFIPASARVGLVGRNGSGKTTLLRLLSKVEEPDAGRIEIAGSVTIGYLPQEGARIASGTVLEALLSAFPEVARLEAEMVRLHDAMAHAEGKRLDELTRQAGDLQHRFEVAGGFTLESEARRILTGLGFAPADAGRPVVELSGGFRMRAALGALLLRAPDLFLLDEPTNHLDLDAVEWLETFLAESPSALVIVSHDRAFLNRLVTSVADLERGRITVYTGNYERYRAEKQAARDRLLALASQEGRRIAEIERFVERFRYKATKARQVQSRIKMLEKMNLTEVEPEEKDWRFLLPPAPRSAAVVVRLSGLRKSYPGRDVLGRKDEGLQLELRRGDRVALMGPNGSGKSTLLKILAGLLGPDAGDVEVGDKVAMHYFAQHLLETLTAGRTVLEEMQAWAPSRTPGELRSLLGVFQFRGDDVFKRVEALSGGEKSRLALARLMLDPGNLLLLDEPTNHLDLPAREALEDALSRYDGSLMFVSHDRYFIAKVATRVMALSDGLLKPAAGYEEAALRGELPVQAEGPADQAAAPPAPAPDRETRRARAEARNERNRRLKASRDRVASLEKEITAAEGMRDELDARMADPSTYQTEGLARELGERRKEILATLSRLDRAWEEALSELERAESETPPE